MTKDLRHDLAEVSARKEAFSAGKEVGIDLVFDRLKEDLKGYIGLNYLEDLRRKYKETIC
jgi:hypothetical protein